MSFVERKYAGKAHMILFPQVDGPPIIFGTEEWKAYRKINPIPYDLRGDDIAEALEKEPFTVVEV